MSTDLPALRLGFAGTPEFAVPALEALHGAHRICAVFTQPDRPAGRGQALHQSPIKARALDYGLSVYQPADFKSPQALETLRSLQLDALVVVAYGLILPAAALQCPKLGCINIHASLLPRWRGAAPIQRAVLAGDAKTGITIMRMEAGLDTGPMLAVREMDIGAHDTAKTLHDELARLGAELIGETLQGLVLGRTHPVPQPSAGITYAQKINKAEALIDWHQDVLQIWRRVRAFNPWPTAQTRLNGVQLRILEAEPRSGDAEPRDSTPAQSGETAQSASNRPDSGAAGAPGTVLAATQDGIDVACGSGVLRILRLQLSGRKPLAAREFIRGQRLDGVRFAPS